MFLLANLWLVNASVWRTASVQPAKCFQCASAKSIACVNLQCVLRTCRFKPTCLSDNRWRNGLIQPNHLARNTCKMRWTVGLDHLLSFEHTTNAAIAPGTHPNRVRSATIRTVPQPLSSTANGGNRMHRRALPQPIPFSPFLVVGKFQLSDSQKSK